MKKILKIFNLLLLSSCVSYFTDFKKAKRYLNQGLCKEAYTSFVLSLQNKEKKSFLKKAASFCEIKNPEIGFLFYKELLNQTEVFKEKRVLQKKVATFLFKQKKYNQALFYYEKLLSTSKVQKEKNHFIYNIAISFFNLKKYNQALLETNKLLKQTLSGEDKKKALLLKGRIFISMEDFKKATSFFEEKIKELPKLSNFFRKYLALLFEEKGELRRAVRELEQIDPQTPFSQNKQRKLQERLTNQPKGGL